jgi:TatD DNase family protein
MSAAGLVDSHAHLMDAAFDADRALVLERALAANVVGLVLVGYDLVSSRAAIDLARSLPRAWAAVGIHPNSVSEAAASDFDEIAALAREPEVVAIGETGLDYYRRFSTRASQRDALRWHQDLARQLSLPLIVHNREADGDVAELLAPDRPSTARNAGILHCFSSSDPIYLRRMLDAGYLVSFAGTLTFKNADTLRSMAHQVPLDRLLVETDCPYLSPVPHRGQRNEPAFVRATAHCLATLRGLSFESLTEQLWLNTLRIFPAFERIVQEVA